MHITRQPLFFESVKTSELYVRSDGFVTTDETWSQEPLYAPYTRIYYVISGGGVLYSEKEEILLEPGYVYLAPCGMKYGFYSHATVTKLFFHVNVALNRGGCDPFSNYSHFIRIPMAIEEMEFLKKLYLSSDPYDHMLLKSALYQTVCEGLRTVRSYVGDVLRYSDVTAAAIGYIYRNLNASLTVSDVAEGIFCSKSKLSTLFRSEVGQSISRYIDELLLSEAGHRLIYGNESIGEISEHLGFCDQFYFSRKFTGKFGISPLQFRKKKRREVEPAPTST